MMRPEADARSDDALLRSAMSGDAASFGALCERHRALVWNVAATVADGTAADDIAQEAAVRAYRSLSSYRGDAPFPAWLCRIALNAAHDYRRSAWFRRVLCFGELTRESQARTDPTAAALGRATQRELRQAVAELPDRERVPIWLHYFEGFTIAEIARLYASPDATVRSRVRAGLRRLRKRLGHLEEADMTGLWEAEQCL